MISSNTTNTAVFNVFEAFFKLFDKFPINILLFFLFFQNQNRFCHNNIKAEVINKLIDEKTGKFTDCIETIINFLFNK